MNSSPTPHWKKPKEVRRGLVMHSKSSLMDNSCFVEFIILKWSSTLVGIVIYFSKVFVVWLHNFILQTLTQKVISLLHLCFLWPDFATGVILLYLLFLNNSTENVVIFSSSMNICSHKFTFSRGIRKVNM